MPAALASAVGRRGAIVIRSARPTDGDAVRRLGQLADRHVPQGPLLLAEADGDLLALASVAGGVVIADPFVVTGDVMELLELRRKQLKAAA